MTKQVVAVVAIAIALWTTSCSPPPTGARAQYNSALTSLNAGDYEAAEKAFLAARDEAGNDPELRFRAAYNLALAYSKHGEGEQEPQKALDLLGQAAAWFRDAIRLRPEADDARANLELVLLRMDSLSDQLNKGQNSLEARLDRVIEDQRSLRDKVRRLVAEVDAAGASTEPGAFQNQFDALATFERTLLAEAGTVSDLAGDERDAIDNKSEQERTDEDRMRAVQLGNLEQYLQLGRVGIADARRFLRRLQGDSAHRRADAALAELKRAREQLQDPVTVLRGIAEDEALLHLHSQALAAVSAGTLSIDGEEKAAKAPAWLTNDHLRERQDAVRERADELTARLQAGVDSHAREKTGENGESAPEPPGQPGQEDAQQERLLQAVAQALPFVRTAAEAMGKASGALSESRTTTAVDRELEALEGLAAAIERFSGMRALIELAYAEQNQIIALLTPTADGQANSGPELSTGDRLATLRESISRNIDRLGRLENLFADELAKVDQQGAQAKAQAEGQGSDPEQLAQLDQQLAAQRQKFATAQDLRLKALASLDALTAAVDDIAARPARWKPGAAGPLAPAKEGLGHIEELRRLFFSVVEHLEELVRNQTETRDDTATTSALEGAEKAAAIAPLKDRQDRHQQMSAAIAEALAQQADAAAQSPPQPGAAGQDPAQAAAKLGEAAEEVRAATTEMASASDLLREGSEQASAASWDIEPTLTRQGNAVDRLTRALELLKPPPPPEQNQDQQDQQQQQQQQQDQQMSQQQADRRLQRARESEAERQRQRRQRQRIENDPVEKDW